MKSLLISSTYFPPQVGGISSYMASVVKSLAPEEICCLTGARADNNRTDSGLHARIYRRPRAFTKAPYLQALMMGATAVEILIRERPEVVQVATAYDGYLALQLNRWVKVPFVIYAHGNEILDAAGEGYQKPKLSLQCAARVIANSQFTAGLVANLAVSPQKIVVLHPGCDVERFRPQAVSLSLRQQLLQHHWQDRVILTVGGLVARKGHDMVIRALPRVLQEVPNSVYLIIGDGPNRPELENLAAQAGVQGRVMFAGRVPNKQLPQAYALADVFVMASRMHLESCDVEGFGLVFLEASACGKPVIGGRCGGVPDAIVDGMTGLLVDPRDPKDIAGSIIRVLQSPGWGSELGDRGRQRVLQEFTWDCFARRLREVLCSVVKGNVAPAPQP